MNPVTVSFNTIADKWPKCFSDKRNPRFSTYANS